MWEVFDFTASEEGLNRDLSDKELNALEKLAPFAPKRNVRALS